LKNPIHFYWIRFEEGGTIKGLFYLQEKFSLVLTAVIYFEKKLLLAFGKIK